jgi:hypothetical protein
MSISSAHRPTVFTLFLSLALLATACKGGKNNVPTPPSDTAALPMIDLETHGCRGYCPAYKLQVFQNGAVAYEGLRNMEKMGKAVFSLTPNELAKLKGKMADVNLWQYPERFPSTIADAPASTLTIHDRDKSHSIYGAIERPKPIIELENLLKDLTEAHGLRVKRGIDPNAIEEDALGEVLVKLKDGINAGNWITQFDKPKLRLLRRISSENLWLVAYDTTQIGEEDLIKRLKSTEGVVEAQPNRTVKERD